MPLVNPSSFAGCAPRTALLADYFGKQVPAGRDFGSLSFLQFLTSAQNTSGVRRLSDDIVGVPGKKRGVKLMFTTPLCVSVCSTTFDCTDTKGAVIPAVQFAEFDIATEYHVCTGIGVPSALKFTDSEFAQYCELNDETFLQEQYAEFDMSMFKAVDKQLVSLLRTQINVANDVNFPFLKVNTATGHRALSDEWLFWISTELSENHGVDIMDVVLFGGRMIKTIQQKYKLATASTEGYDLSKSTGEVPALYYDRNFDVSFGTNAIVAIPLKALQLVTFNKYVGAKSFRGEKEINFTKVMPLGNGSSITFDYQWRRDVECAGYSYFPSIFAELVKTVSSGCAGATADGFVVFADCAQNELPICVV